LLATEIEGIFRLAGSEKRIKELRETFNSPDRYGKGLDWTGYTVHDAANILRRYFNQLPEPIIPLEHYERFRNPLREYVSSTNGPDGGAQLVGNFDVDAVIRVYQKLITEIPPLNRQLLLYILDLLAVFAAKSDQNKMTTQNLAAIFQPGILNHPQHDMAPNEYRLSQAVLVFLIENQDHFIVGMQGTAADEQTIQEVQSGARGSSTPTRAKSTTLGRSSSNASAGADSVRRYGGVRRNVSVSSRTSRNSVAGQSPVTPSFAGNIHRSNTVPSKKSPAIASGLFKDRPSDPPTPATPGELVDAPQPEPAGVTHLAPPEVISPSSDDSTPLASEINPASPMVMTTPERPIPNPMGQLSAAKSGAHGEQETATTPSASGVRSFTNMLLRTTSQEPDKKDGRKGNKLQKKRAPGSSNPSAHSSTHSLTGALAADAPPSPMPAFPNKDPLAPPPMLDSLKPSMSPSASFRSHSTMTDYSEQDPAQHGEDTPTAPTAADQERKRRWRFSKDKERRDAEKAAAHAPHDDTLGAIPAAKQSMSSVSSSGAPLSPEQTVVPQQQQPPAEAHEQQQQQRQHHFMGLSANGKDKDKDKERERERDRDRDDGKKNPIDWFKGKLAEHKDKAEKKRAKSPPAPGQHPGVEEAASRSSLHLGRPKEEGQRRSGRSMDIPRRTEKDEGY
jgi:GTPase-activating protein SAC7